MPFLPHRPPRLHSHLTNAIPLRAELEQCAAQAIAAGRFNDIAEVVAAGSRLLQRAEAERAGFEASLDAAIAEGERDRFLTVEAIEREMDALIDATPHG